MNWDAIGAIGEIFGGIAVVVSLLYLAAQIRQNSRIVKGASTHNITATIQTELRWSADYGESFLKAIENPETLSKVEAFKLGEWMTAAMMARQNEYVQYRQKLIDDDVWLSSRGILKNMLSIHWAREWWENFDQSTFLPEFVSLVSEIMREASQFDYENYTKFIGKNSDNGT